MTWHIILDYCVFQLLKATRPLTQMIWICHWLDTTWKSYPFPHPTSSLVIVPPKFVPIRVPRLCCINSKTLRCPGGRTAKRRRKTKKRRLTMDLNQQVCTLMFLAFNDLHCASLHYVQLNAARRRKKSRKVRALIPVPWFGCGWKYDTQTQTLVGWHPQWSNFVM